MDISAQRTSLLVTAVAALDREKAALPAAWAAATRAEARAEIARELKLDRSYQSLTARMMSLATRRATRANVRGLERIVRAIQQKDVALGTKRPEAVASLIDAVQAKLDAARRLRLARDRYALRAPALRSYRLAIRTPIALFAQLKPSLEAVKALSGSAPNTLAAMQRTATRILQLAAAITPPTEVASAHALLISAVQLAGNAAQIRREATLASDMTRAWDASSAAAGALMLGARARADIQTQLRLPQLR